MKTRMVLLFGGVAACIVPILRGQAQGADVLVQARAQLRERNLDSAAALLRQITDSTRWADTVRRLNALVLVGIVRYYMGENATSLASFRAAIEVDSSLTVPRLAEMDPALGALFDSARVEVAREPSRDTLYSCSPRCVGLEIEPKLLDDGTHQARVLVFADVGGDQLRGSALLRAVLDTLGHVEPGSIEVVRSTLPQELLQEVLQSFLGARYRPGRAHGRTVRVLIERSIQMQPRPQH
jgi:hypothetical protein